MKKAFCIACLSALGMHAILAAQQPPVAGPNRNVVGGPVKWTGTPFESQLITGDPRAADDFCMVDSRNLLVIGCAFNDYTPVELPGLAADGETGDADWQRVVHRRRVDVRNALLRIKRTTRRKGCISSRAGCRGSLKQRPKRSFRVFSGIALNRWRTRPTA
jgi:hypothetical protein